MATEGDNMTKDKGAHNQERSMRAQIIEIIESYHKKYGDITPWYDSAAHMIMGIEDTGAAPLYQCTRKAGDCPEPEYSQKCSECSVMNDGEPCEYLIIRQPTIGEKKP